MGGSSRPFFNHLFNRGRSEDTPLQYYSRGFKARMVQRMSGPESISATRLAQEVGVSQNTLSRWLRQAGGVKRNGSVSDEKPGRPDELPSFEKLRLVMEAASLSDEDLGEFLRKNGIHEAQLEQWRKAAVGALEPQKPSRRRKSPEAKRIQELERELNRKDKALAEVTALLALKKKLETLMGDGDESTTPRNDR